MADAPSKAQQREEARRRAAALAAGGALAIGAGDGEGHVGDVAKAVPSTVKRAGAAAAIIGALVTFLTDQRQRSHDWLSDELAKRASLRGGGVERGLRVGRRRVGSSAAVGISDIVARVLAEEEGREAEFTRRQTERFARDLAATLSIPDPDERERAVRGIVSREEFYVRQRSMAMAARAFAAVDRVVLREQSPQGAFWLLDPTVREHTAGCLFMGGKFWPWAVLDRVHPPRHAGCPCRLISYGEAVANGHMQPGDVMDVRTAIRRAAGVVMEGVVEDLDDPEALRDLLFEARTIEMGDALVLAEAATMESVEQARANMVLGLARTGDQGRRFGALGLGRDPEGFFVYTHRVRSRSFESADEVPDAEVQRVGALQ